MSSPPRPWRPSSSHEAPRDAALDPATTGGRHNGTLRLSYDEGKTWPVQRTIHPGSFAYSCLAVLPDMNIGCLFEEDGYRKISFVRVSLDWLTRGKDQLHPKP